MALNMIFLPLTGLVTIDEFINLMVTSDLEFVNVISKNMGSMAAFYVTYLLQVTFLSNCIQLLDLPHFMYKSFVSNFMIFRTEKWTDDWFFPLGYFTAYTQTIGLMCLLFSVTMPLVTGLAALFFFTRFYIEKYNMLFVF